MVNQATDYRTRCNHYYNFCLRKTIKSHSTLQIKTNRTASWFRTTFALMKVRRNKSSAPAHFYTYMHERLIHIILTSEGLGTIFKFYLLANSPGLLKNENTGNDYLVTVQYIIYVPLGVNEIIIEFSIVNRDNKICVKCLFFLLLPLSVLQHRLRLAFDTRSNSYTRRILNFNSLTNIIPNSIAKTNLKTQKLT